MSEAAQTATPSASAPDQNRSAMMDDGNDTPASSSAPSNGSPPANTGSAPKTIDMTQDANGDWRANFTQGLDDQTKETWGKLSSRYTSPAEMAKAHVNLVKTMDQRIPIPGPDAKPEEVDGVFQKLGMPEKAEDYRFNFEGIQHWDDGRRSQIKELAPLFRKARATQSQVDEFVRQQAELDKIAADAAQAQANTLRQQRMRQLQTEWRGDDFNRNKSFVKATVEHYAGADKDEIANMRLADGTFAVDHPAFARMFAKIGAERSEDDRDPTVFNAGARDSVKAQIEKLESEALEKGLTPSDPRWPNKQLEPLYQKLHGRRNDYGAYNGARA